MSREALDLEPATPLETVSTGVPVRGRPNGAQRSRRAKSEVTHERLRRATARLLEEKPLRDLKVADITALASVSPSTFYIYFADVNDAVLAVLEEAYKTLPDYPALVSAITLETLRPGVNAYIKAYLTYWDAHYALLRVRNLAADEGDRRFRESRARHLWPMIDALTLKIEELRAGRPDQDDTPAVAMAVVASGALERLGSVIRLRPPGGDELTPERLVDAATLMLCGLLAPRSLGT